MVVGEKVIKVLRSKLSEFVWKGKVEELRRR